MGFEPTRGDPIGLAGRRLNHSAKVSLPTLGWSSFCVGLCGRSALVRSVAIAGLFQASALALAVGYIAQWLERLTADQQVPGSNPGVPSFGAAVGLVCVRACAGCENIRPAGIEPGTI